MIDAPELLIERDDVRQIAALAAMILDDPDADEALRDQADAVFQQTHWWLLYQEQPRPVRLVPVTFGWIGAHTELVEELLLDIGSQVVADNPATVLMARRMATMADDEGFSTQCRLEAFDGLNDVLGLLKAASDDEDDDADDAEERGWIERGNNSHPNQ